MMLYKIYICFYPQINRHWSLQAYLSCSFGIYISVYLCSSLHLKMSSTYTACVYYVSVFILSKNLFLEFLLTSSCSSTLCLWLLWLLQPSLLYVRHCKKEIVISTSHLPSEFQVSKQTYYMHGQLILWTDCLKIQNTFTFSSEPNIYPFASQGSSQECLLICITNARILACDMDRWMSGLEEKMIVVMCFWIPNQSVHRINCVHTCNTVTHLNHNSFLQCYSMHLHVSWLFLAVLFLIYINGYTILCVWPITQQLSSQLRQWKVR